MGRFGGQDNVQAQVALVDSPAQIAVRVARIAVATRSTSKDLPVPCGPISSSGDSVARAARITGSRCPQPSIFDERVMCSWVTSVWCINPYPFSLAKSSYPHNDSVVVILLGLCGLIGIPI